MNVAVIFAGGSGKRMNSGSRPKQFLELNGKPVIIYTLEIFENHPQIDAICVVCLETWIPFLKKQLQRFDITKVVDIVPGGKTGQDSIYKGLCAAENWAKAKNYDVNVLIHDGVRPLITEKTVSDNIEMCSQKGNCITCVPATETFIIKQPLNLACIPEREHSLIARAPQSFKLVDILSAHKKAIDEGKHDFIDSCTLMSHYGHQMNTVMGPMENIKITTPTDFFVFRAMIEMREKQQIFGIQN